jgi:hypothetical protein
MLATDFVAPWTPRLAQTVLADGKLTCSRTVCRDVERNALRANLAPRSFLDGFASGG